MAAVKGEPRVIRCPTAFCAPSTGSSSAEDKAILQTRNAMFVAALSELPLRGLNRNVAGLQRRAGFVLPSAKGKRRAHNRRDGV